MPRLPRISKPSSKRIARPAFNPFSHSHLFDSWQNRTGWLTATDSAIAFLPLQSLMDQGTVHNWAADLGKAINNDATLTPLQQAQYKIQLDWLATGDVPQTEFILFSKGFAAQTDQSYFSMLSGIQHPFSRGSVVRLSFLFLILSRC